LAEVQSLDNAYWWVEGEVVAIDRPDRDYMYRGRAPDDREFAIATLREVLEAFPGVFINLDIKQTAPVVAPYEERLAALLAEYGRVDDVIVASFNDVATEAFKRHAPDVCTSAGTMAVADFYRAVRDGEAAPDALTRHVALQVPASFQDITLVDEPFVTRAHDAGLAVHVWTIDDADEMRRLLDLDVDGIMTDRPSVLGEVLLERSG
jgi:glycerophosphoryl diester phosphodiesterase